MVVRQILVLFVEVRILVGQQETPRKARGFVFSGSVKERSELYEREGARNEAPSKF